MKSLRDQILTKCVHFTGVQNVTCEAGIRYLDVRDSGAKFPANFPCFSDNGHQKPCPSAKWRTPEEADAEAKRIEDGFAERLARTGRGLCFHCGEKVEKYEQVGHCAYATPCGCRFGQADAKGLNESLATARALPESHK